MTDSDSDFVSSLGSRASSIFNSSPPNSDSSDSGESDSELIVPRTVDSSKYAVERGNYGDFSGVLVFTRISEDGSGSSIPLLNGPHSSGTLIIPSNFTSAIVGNFICVCLGMQDVFVWQFSSITSYFPIESNIHFLGKFGEQVRNYLGMQAILAFSISSLIGIGSSDVRLNVTYTPEPRRNSVGIAARQEIILKCSLKPSKSKVKNSGTFKKVLSSRDVHVRMLD